MEWGEKSFLWWGLKETACERNVWNDAVECGGVGNFSIIHFMFLMAAREIASNKTWGEGLDLQFCCPIEYFQQ